MKAIGLDIGTLTAKAVILGSDGAFVYSLIPSADEAEASAQSVMSEVLKKAGMESPNGAFIVSTGAGAKVSLSQQQKAITTCLARGVSFLLPSARMVIDMGAESSTVLKINDRGRVVDWAGQDKCAAGTGIFLQQMAKLMQMPIQEMSELAFQAKGKADISGTCAVFAESEVISHVHRVPPTPKPDIVAGIYSSVVSRIMAMCKRIGIQKDVAVVGGVALNRGLVVALEKELRFPVLVPENPQMVAALGAAILARENLEKGVK